MTGPLDLIGSLNAAVTAYQTAQDMMVAASQQLRAEDQGVQAEDAAQPEGESDGSVPA